MVTPDLDRQSSEIDHAARVLEISQGTFSLSLATCNSPALRDHLITRLNERVPGGWVVRLPKGMVDVHGYVRDQERPNEATSVHLIGIEDSVSSAETYHPTLRAFNASRELWPMRFNMPVFLWAPEYVSRLLPMHAPDIWRWFSHQYEFVADHSIQGSMDGVISGFVPSAITNLDVDQKHLRIAELERRIHAAGDPPPDQLAIHVSNWLNELGVLYGQLGQLDDAETALRRALEIYVSLGRLKDIAALYGNLGVLYGTRGDLDASEQLFTTALEIDEGLERLDAMADDYSNLAVLCGQQGKLDESEQHSLKALEINQQLGRKDAIVSQLENLGTISRKRGHYEQAEKMYVSALEIAESIGDLQTMANQYGNLGLVHDHQGDLERAKEMMLKALQLFDQIGGAQGRALSLGNLGNLFLKLGDSNKACECWKNARELFAGLGSESRVAQLDHTILQYCSKA